MRFLLVFVLSFVSLFAIAQAPPMVLGGPQGIDVTRLLVRNWMTTPIYTDTPAGPLTGAGWPGRGYLITVIKNETPCVNCPPKDTTLWIYTGARWKRVGYDYITKLVYGGQVSKASGSNLNYIIQPYGAFFDGDYKTSLTNKTATLAPKTINNTGRIDVLVLNRDSFEVKTGIPKAIPQKPLVTGSEVEVASFYFEAFDSIPTIINTSAKVTNIYRVAGIDSFYFNIDTLTFAIKDSIGISKNDTASMLNNYRFTAANGLTKDSTTFRLGGSLNQNTNINLNTRRLTIIGGSDTTRFFSGGQVSIGGTPDSNTVHHLVNRKNSRLGNLEILSGVSAARTGAGIRIDGVDQPFKFQGSGQANTGITFQFVGWPGDTVPANAGFPSRDIIRVSQGFVRVAGVALDTGRYNVLNIEPKYNIWYDSGRTLIRGIYYNPTIQALNKTNHVAYQNTTGSNLMNSTSGNTRIGYALVDTNNTYKLDVNGSANIQNILNFGGTTSSNIRLTGDGNPIGGSVGDMNELVAIGSYVGNSLQSTGGGSMVAIGINAATTTTTGGRYSVMIGRNAGNGITTGSENTIIGANDAVNINSSTSNAIHLIAGGGYEENRADSALLGLTSRYAFIGGGFSSSFYINDFYLGGGNRVRNTHLAHINLYAPSAFPTKADTIGSNFTINAGRGTGTGLGGSVIFSTSSPTTSGTTLQTLTERARISPAGNLLVGTATDVPSSKLTVTSTTQGFLQPRMTNTQRDAISTPAQGLQVFSTTDSANYVYRGTGGGWQKIANEISGSYTLDFPSTGHGNSADLTFTVTGASEGDVVALGIPNASIVANASFIAWVSATNTVTVRFNNYAGSGSSDPASGTFKIKVFK